MPCFAGILKSLQRATAVVDRTCSLALDSFVDVVEKLFGQAPKPQPQPQPQPKQPQPDSDSEPEVSDSGSESESRSETLVKISTDVDEVGAFLAVGNNSSDVDESGMRVRSWCNWHGAVAVELACQIAAMPSAPRPGRLSKPSSAASCSNAAQELACVLAAIRTAAA
eukprot:tig00000430_g655.t1